MPSKAVADCDIVQEACIYLVRRRQYVKLGGSKTNAGQGVPYECAFAVFKTRRDFRYKDISVEKLGVSVPNIFYIPSDRAVDLSLFSDIFHRQECDSRRIGQNFSPLV